MYGELRGGIARWDARRVERGGREKSTGIAAVNLLFGRRAHG